MSRRRFFLRLAAAGAVLCAVGVPVRAQEPSLEYNVKAALILNFARFIEWPDSAFAGPREPIEVCVVAPTPFGQALERALQGETVGQRTLSAREVSSPAQSAGCHLLFVPSGAETRASALMRRGGHTVTVGESRRFEQMGGAVSFTLEDGRVRFNVNLSPVEERGVRISARMLQLASRVDRVTPRK